MLTSQLPFHKWQGAGNDFVVLDLLAYPLPDHFDFERAAPILCDRHFGVGGDGLLTLETATDDCDLRMRMWNPDGSEDMCGNGLRCVAGLAWARQYVTQKQFAVQTLAGTRRIDILEPHLIRAAMGAPQFAPPAVPILLPHRSDALSFEIEVAGRTFVANSLSTGSTHTVIFLDAPLADAEFERLGPLLEHHPLFPTRTSVMWAVSDGPNRFQIRIWERGAGETLACGTGACAVAVAAIETRRAASPVTVESKGGALIAEWKPGEEIFLTGPTHPVFESAFNFPD